MYAHLFFTIHPRTMMHIAIAYKINVKTHVSIYIFHTNFQLSNGFMYTYFLKCIIHIAIAYHVQTYIPLSIYIYTPLFFFESNVHDFIYIYIYACTPLFDDYPTIQHAHCNCLSYKLTYGVATISWLLKIIGLFCKRAL